MTSLYRVTESDSLVGLYNVTTFADEKIRINASIHGLVVVLWG